MFSEFPHVQLLPGSFMNAASDLITGLWDCVFCPVAAVYRWSHSQRGPEDGQTAATNHQREVSWQDRPHYRTPVQELEPSLKNQFPILSNFRLILHNYVLIFVLSSGSTPSWTVTGCWWCMLGRWRSLTPRLLSAKRTSPSSSGWSGPEENETEEIKDTLKIFIFYAEKSWRELAALFLHRAAEKHFYRQNKLVFFFFSPVSFYLFFLTMEQILQLRFV